MLSQPLGKTAVRYGAGSEHRIKVLCELSQLQLAAGGCRGRSSKASHQVSFQACDRYRLVRLVLMLVPCRVGLKVSQPYWTDRRVDAEWLLKWYLVTGTKSFKI